MFFLAIYEVLSFTRLTRCTLSAETIGPIARPLLVLTRCQIIAHICSVSLYDCSSWGELKLFIFPYTVQDSF